MSYAKDTEVSVAKSRAEIEDLISKYGAHSFGVMTTPEKAAIMFIAHGKQVRFFLPLPDREDERFRFSNHKSKCSRTRYDDTRTYKNWEQGCRTAWRALLLCVKAKLESVQSGITSFEQEFLAHFVMPNGQTFGEYAIPQIEETTRSGRMPTLMLAGGGA